MILLVASGCARPAVTTLEKAFRPVMRENVEIADDLDFAGLAVAIAQQRDVLKNKEEMEMVFGPERVSRREYAKALDGLATIVTSSRSQSAKLEYIRDSFRFMEWYGGNDWGEILLTSYFEPIIHGDEKRTFRFSQALYGKPDDLVVIDLKKFSERFRA